MSTNGVKWSYRLPTSMSAGASPGVRHSRRATTAASGRPVRSSRWKLVICSWARPAPWAAAAITAGGRGRSRARSTEVTTSAWPPSVS
ncbi:hypothetical protein RKD18_004219 [Streptomyces phaeoluteigriseus]